MYIMVFTDDLRVFVIDDPVTVKRSPSSLTVQTRTEIHMFPSDVEFALYNHD